MKKPLSVLILVLIAVSAYSQNLLDIYKSGKVELVPDTEYAKDVDWDRALESWTDNMVGRWVGDRKSLQIAPDGSAIVSHHFRDFYTVFSPEGDFQKELQVTNAQGRVFESLPPMHGVLDGHIYYSGLDNMGQMLCFDKDGKLIKTLHLDYAAKQIIPLPGKKLALVGWVLWQSSVREFVAIVDYETNEEKIIWDNHTPKRFGPDASRDMFYYTYDFKEGGMIGFSTMPFARSLGMSSPPIIANVGDKLIVTIPQTGEIRTYDLDGNFVGQQTIDWTKSSVSVEEQKEIQRKAIQRYRNMQDPDFAAWVSPEENLAARDHIVREMEKDLEKISRPVTLPAFSTLIKDSDDNLLFFGFPEEEGANHFNVWVYGNGGEFVAQSSFNAEGYDLEIKPSKMVFHDGHIYALIVKNAAQGVPLRLVRFELRGEE